MSSLSNRLSARRRSLIRAVLSPPAMGRHIAAAVLATYARAQQRRALLSLDDRMLKDIGLTRADVDGECRKPFWRT